MHSLNRLAPASCLLKVAFALLSLCGCQFVRPGTLPAQVVLKPLIDSSAESTEQHDPPTLAMLQPIMNQPEAAAETESAEGFSFFEPPSELDMMASSPVFPEPSIPVGREGLNLAERIFADHQNFYSPESLTMLGAGLLVGGTMANSSIDNEIHRRFQSSVRSANSDEWFESLHSSKELGNGKYTLPIFAGSWAVGKLFPDSPLAETTGMWGERSIRGFLVGAPPLLVLQQLTGGSRPTETSEGPEWHPLADNNGISGHSFMGSLPFITAAKMTESRSLRFTYYAASTIAPLSRMNDNAHYPSQVALGWWMAYLAASAVEATDHPDSRWKFYPFSSGDRSGILAEFKF